MNHIVEQAMNGDKKALGELCRIKAQSIVYLCVQLMGSLQDGEDAAQEVFIQIQKSIGELSSAKAFTVWLRKLVVYTCSGMRRKEMKNKSTQALQEFDELDGIVNEETLEFLPEAYFLDNEWRQELVEIINNLPFGMKSCILLYYYDDMKVSEIAKVLDCSESAVKMQLQRARLKLRFAIEQKHPDIFEIRALLPMSALGGLLRSQEQEIPLAVLKSCLRGAGLAPGVGGAAVAASGSLVRYVGIGLATVALAGGAVAFAASSPSLAAQPPGYPQISDGAPNDGFEDIGSLHSHLVTYPGVPDGSAPQPCQISGQVMMKDTHGAVIPGSGGYAAGFYAEISKDGARLEIQEISDTGSFTLDAPITQEGEYTLTIIPLSSRGAALAEGNASMAVQLTPGDHLQLDTIYVTDTISPVVTVSFYDEAGAHTLVNPTSAKISALDLTAITCQWQLVSVATGETLAEDTGQGWLPDFAQLCTGQPDGTYSLTVLVTDEAGNQATATETFYIT